MTTSEQLQAAFKYLFIDEVAALKTLARSLPRNPRVINIGAGSGTSGLALMESRHDIFLTTIDVQNDDSPFGCLSAEAKAIDEAGFGNVSGMLKRYTQIHDDSKKVGLEFNGFRNFDMVFIDGDHSYEGAKGDIEAWLPNIKPGGILAVHDYHKDELYDSATDYKPDAPHPQDWPGVTKAVDEILVGKYELIMRVDSLVAFRME